MLPNAAGRGNWWHRWELDTPCEGAGTLTFTKVEVSRNLSGWEPAAAGMELGNNDRVHTGFKAGVVLNFPDGSRLTVGPMTLLQLTNIAVGPEGGVQARLLLKTGEVKAQINRSTGARGDFQVKTPTTTASVRGTTFSVAYDGTATTVAVTESSVEVTANGGAKVVVTAGMETRSTASSVAPPVAIGKGFKSGGLSSAQALARLTGKLASGLTRCKLGVVSNGLAPAAGGWSARLGERRQRARAEDRQGLSLTGRGQPDAP